MIYFQYSSFDATVICIVNIIVDIHLCFYHVDMRVLHIEVLLVTGSLAVYCVFSKFTIFNHLFLRCQTLIFLHHLLVSHIVSKSLIFSLWFSLQSLQLTCIWSNWTIVTSTKAFSDFEFRQTLRYSLKRCTSLLKCFIIHWFCLAVFHFFVCNVDIEVCTC